MAEASLSGHRSEILDLINLITDRVNALPETSIDRASVLTSSRGRGQLVAGQPLDADDTDEKTFTVKVHPSVCETHVSRRKTDDIPPGSDQSTFGQFDDTDEPLRFQASSFPRWVLGRLSSTSASSPGGLNYRNNKLLNDLHTQCSMTTNYFRHFWGLIASGIPQKTAISIRIVFLLIRSFGVIALYGKRKTELGSGVNVWRLP